MEGVSKKVERELYNIFSNCNPAGKKISKEALEVLRAKGWRILEVMARGRGTWVLEEMKYLRSGKIEDIDMLSKEIYIS